MCCICNLLHFEIVAFSICSVFNLWFAHVLVIERHVTAEIMRELCDVDYFDRTISVL